MNENIEIDILEKFSLPHIFFPQNTIQQKEMLAWHVASLSGEEILLASSFAFSYEGFLAGLTMSQIEYFAKNAPVNYKRELINSINKEYKIKEVMEIAKMMDDDLGGGARRNQDRVMNVRQYVYNNQEVFQF